MALTDAQMVDVRRYLGYWTPGTTFVVTDDQDTVYMQFGMVIMSLYTRLTNLDDAELTVLTTIYLPNLNALELAIPASGANLDTDQAAVWVHNKNEVRDRVRLYNTVRRQLCSFIGIPPGPGLGNGGITLSRA